MERRYSVFGSLRTKALVGIATLGLIATGISGYVSSNKSNNGAPPTRTLETSNCLLMHRLGKTASPETDIPHYTQTEEFSPHVGSPSSRVVNPLEERENSPPTEIRYHEQRN